MLFCFFDIEADGPAPGVHSMLSIGVVLVDSLTTTVVDTWSANFAPLAGATKDPKTMEFWAREAEAYEANTRDPRDPALAIPELREWIERHQKTSRLEPVAKPASFDWPFLNYYLWRFTGGNPLATTSCHCSFTYLWAISGNLDPRAPTKRLSNRWASHMRRMKHVAVDDAREDAVAFARMVADHCATVRWKSVRGLFSGGVLPGPFGV